MKKTILSLLMLLLVSLTAVADVTYSQELYEKAVLGDGEAMYQLSLCYMNGLGVAADYDKSDYWLERAAQEGQPNAVAAMSAMRGKTGLSDAKRRELASEEKSERERLEKELVEKKAAEKEAKQKKIEQDCLVVIDEKTGNQSFTINGVTFTMVKVDGGTFWMGATEEQAEEDVNSDELPIHSVTLSSYYIGQTEVTQGLWVAVMGENPSHFNNYVGRINYGVNLNRPVENVSRDECQEFVSKLNQMTGKNFRLPTEAEWEFAARGGNKSKGYRYSGSNKLGDVAWYEKNSESKGEKSSDYGTHSVATKRANELGLYDMSGNVLEWCSDWYGHYTSSSQYDPQGPSKNSNSISNPMFRGGSWDSSAEECRVSYRYNGWGFVGSHGLRLAL